jgi:hypothetical protein
MEKRDVKTYGMKKDRNVPAVNQRACCIARPVALVSVNGVRVEIELRCAS